MAFKITIDNEEVLCDKDFKIEEEMLNTSSVILNNVYPTTWENTKDYVSNFYYPKDYSKCKIFNETVYPAYEGTTVEGSFINVNDVDLTYDYNYSLLGDTEQNGTPTPLSPIAIETVTGRQVINIQQGNQLFNKNTTNIINANLSNSKINSSTTERVFFMKCKPNTTYTFSIDLPSSYKRNTIATTSEYPNINIAIENAVYSATSPKTYTTNSNAKYILWLFYSTSNPDYTEQETLDSMMINEGSTALPYEAYNGTDYELNLGKNLFNIGSSISDYFATDYNGIRIDSAVSIGNYVTATFENEEITINSYNNSGYRWLSKMVYLKNNTTYTLSANSLPTQIKIVGFNSLADNTTGTELVLINNLTLKPPRTFNSGNYKYYVLSIYPQKADNVFSDIMLEAGSIATSYSAYKTPIELCNIRTYQDRIFYNTEDSPYYDSNLSEAWYLHKEIGKVVLDGTETINQISNARFQIPLQVSSGDGYYASLSKCNLFKTIGHYEIGITSKENVMAVNGGYIYIRIASGTTTQELITLLSSTNAIVYYGLATSTDTEITDSELLETLDNIRLLSGTNNIAITSADLPAIMKLKYNYYDGYTIEDLLFCGVVENTGNISLNPRYPHYCNLQVLDFKHFLSIGETLDFVIYQKTIEETIDLIINSISEYGFIKGNINLLNANDIIGAYSTKDKTAYDVFNYIADITQSRWTTRMIDENTVAIDFYDPSLMNSGTPIQYTNQWFTDNRIIDMQFNYSSKDYRNKQIMTSNEVYANIETTETIVADGYQTQFNTTDKIGNIVSLTLNGNDMVVKTKEEYDLGYSCDFYYTPGNNYFESANLVSGGAIIVIEYYAIIEGREILLDNTEINRVNSITGRKGIVARYENRNDATTTTELSQIGQSYLKYKGTPEITLKVESLINLWNIGENVSFTTAPLSELQTDYMVKKKTINYIATQDEIFYTFELTSSFNSENAINYFDNQRSKANGNIGQGETISRNVDIPNTANIIFYGLEINETSVSTISTLQSELQTPLGVE